jgi:predicted nucleic acid-binding protein
LERDLAQLTVVQPDDELITVCAQLRADGEQAGLALGQKIEADRWIAATAIRLGVPLVAADAVFGDVPGLVVEQPSPNADPGPATT